MPTLSDAVRQINIARALLQAKEVVLRAGRGYWFDHAEAKAAAEGGWPYRGPYSLEAYAKGAGTLADLQNWARQKIREHVEPLFDGEKFEVRTEATGFKTGPCTVGIRVLGPTGCIDALFFAVTV